jgi:hypothetical protein
MVVSLRVLVGPEVPDFVAASRDGYVADRAASGDDPAVAARAAADEQVAALFSDGARGAGQLLYRVEEDGHAVGRAGCCGSRGGLIN